MPHRPARIDREPVAVAGRVELRLGREQGVHVRRAHQPPGLERLGEPEQVLDGRVPPARGPAPDDVPEDVVAEAGAAVLQELVVVAHRQVRVHPVQVVGIRAGHARLLVDVLPDIAEIVLPARRLDHLAQHQHAGVAVGPAGAGLERERVAPGELHHLVHRAEPGPGRALEGVVEVAPQPRRVGEQVLDPDLLRGLGAGEVGNEARQRVVERELAPLRQLRDGDGGEHLVHRAQVEPGVDPVRSVEVLVRRAPGARQQHLAVPGEQHRAGEHVGAGQGLHVALHLRRQVPVARHPLRRRSRPGRRRPLPDAHDPVGRRALDPHPDPQRLPGEPDAGQPRGRGRVVRDALEPLQALGAMPLAEQEVEVGVQRQGAHGAAEGAVDVGPHHGRCRAVDEAHDLARPADGGRLGLSREQGGHEEQRQDQAGPPAGERHGRVSGS